MDFVPFSVAAHAALYVVLAQPSPNLTSQKLWRTMLSLKIRDADEACGEGKIVDDAKQKKSRKFWRVKQLFQGHQWTEIGGTGSHGKI